jgi:hypothetical protein
MASFASLPTELKDAIIAELPQRDLFNLTLASKDLRKVAQLALYRNIPFTCSRGSKAYLRVAALLRRLQDDSSLGSQIKEIDLRTRDYGALFAEQRSASLPDVPRTLGLLIQSSPSLTKLAYYCSLPSAETPLNCILLREKLHPLRHSLKHLTLRCEVFDDNSDDFQSMNSILKGSLDSLREFEALTTLNICLAILYGQTHKVNVPLLANLMPPHLQHLTINDDLWGFDAFIWEGVDITEVLREFLTGESKNKAEWNDAEERWDVTWKRDGEPGWKKSTPELKEFVLDMRCRQYEFYDFWDEPTHRDALKRDVEAQGIRCSILVRKYREL